MGLLGLIGLMGPIGLEEEEEEEQILLKLTKENINVNISTIRHRTHKVFS